VGKPANGWELRLLLTFVSIVSLIIYEQDIEEVFTGSRIIHRGLLLSITNRQGDH